MSHLLHIWRYPGDSPVVRVCTRCGRYQTLDIPEDDGGVWEWVV